ncbi:50S ribosomal protein L20 [Candidatus Parcubacteria bacterium]|nr:50S ribosomal protein L20 [Patescibacteria group bacterium]MCG2694076.1 50S ribosomal protein L20 [Candidatus Parcubacteria bacterium]
MPRVKRGKTHVKRRRNILKKVKGFRGGRKNLIKLAKTAGMKAGAHAYRDRRVKKRVNRGFQQVRIGAALKELGWSYSKFMGALKKSGSVLNRKVLSELAAKEPEIFKKIVEQVKK